jgi:hypothetical protein
MHAAQNEKKKKIREKKKKKKTLGARASFPKCPFRAPLAQSNTQVHHPLATKWVAVVYFSVHGEA